MTGRHPIVSREDGGDDELARLAQIDELLRRVPPVEPPAALVRETLRRVEAGQRRSRSEPRSGWRRGFVAAGVAVAALIGVRVVDMTSLEADSSPQADVAQGPITVATNTAEPTARGGEGGEQEAAQVAMVARDDLAEGQQYYLERVGPHGGVVAGLEDLGGVVDPGTDWANTIEVTKNEDGTPRDGKSGDIVQADQGYRGLVQAMDRGVVDQPVSGLEEEPKTSVEADAAFIEARGYFANTYLPGDAEVRWLRAQVGDGWVRAGSRVALDELARPVVQPFDAPTDKALALYLASDTAAVDGPRRVTLQLGLKGALQAPTRRSPLNVALVVDVAGIADDAERRALWSVTEAMAKRMEAGDRLTLVAAGGTPKVATAGGPAEALRFLAEAYEGRGGGGLGAALDAAYREVRGGMRDDGAVGADLVVLATSSPWAERLVERVHAEAVAGIQLSVIGVGARVDAGPRELAFAGQGRAVHVANADLALMAVEGELAAAGRAVARAIRLRVRLAEGVGLVSVLGSRRLDAVEANEVRTVERAIDLKVAETTGIRADRGDDEDGIQIVIPAFMAGDDHVVLFDVVVPGPGPVMDVRARFKDLVTLGNGEVSASLSLGAGRVAARAEQHNVTQNVMARRVADVLGVAAAHLQAGDPQAARRVLVDGRQAMARVAGHVDGQGRVALLAAYEAVLVDLAGVDTARIASSMRLAARVALGAR